MDFGTGVKIRDLWPTWWALQWLVSVFLVSVVRIRIDPNIGSDPVSEVIQILLRLQSSWECYSYRSSSKLFRCMARAFSADSIGVSPPESSHVVVELH